MYLDWENQAQDYYCIDIEADDLIATKIYVMCWENIKTKQKGECRSYHEISRFFDETAGSVYIGHNILKFDAPVLNSLVSLRLGASCLVDTLVLSTLYYPSIPDGHSLKAWGYRLGKEKIEFDDFSSFSEEMVKYCHQDVSITADLYRKLSRVMLKIGFTEKSCEIQHKITVILQRQHKNGFYFDGQRAMTFYQELRKLEDQMKDEIHEVFPPELKLVRDSSVLTKTGRPTAIYEKDLRRYHVETYEGGARYRAYQSVPFSIGSPKQRVEKLTALGWEPDERTPKGAPKVSEKSLVEFAEESGIREVLLITKWMSINGRANMVRTWLDNWNEDTNSIHGRIFVADTLRFRHQSPNTANVPGVRLDGEGRPLLGLGGYFTYEARDLWTARPGRTLVGTDAAGLELRMLAHYLNRPEFTEQVVNGDPHQYNADQAGVTRPKAKTLLYAIQYGAQAKKVSQIMGCSVQEGAQVRQAFLDRLGITEVMNDAISQQRNGRIVLVDGSRIICPSEHSALNYRLQGGGARVMAQAAIFLEGHIRRNGLDSLKVGDIHDEWQYDVHPDDANRHAELAVQSIREAGEELNLNVPLDGTSKIGGTWAETH